MKKTLKIILNGMLFGIGFMLILGVSYLAIKAWQTANPNLTEGAPTGGLYVGSNETLSSAKRNVLVKRGTREDVATTDTADFDGSCERRYQGHSTGGDWWFYATQIGATPNRLDNYNETSYRRILKTSKGTITSNDGAIRNTLKLQKKCQ